MNVEVFKQIRPDNYRASQKRTNQLWNASQNLLLLLGRYGKAGYDRLQSEDKAIIQQSGVNINTLLREPDNVTDAFNIVSDLDVGSCEYVEPKIAASVRPEHKRQKNAGSHKGQLIFHNDSLVGMIKYLGEPILLGLQTVMDNEKAYPIVPLGLYATTVSRNILREDTPDEPGWIIRQVTSLNITPERIATFGKTESHKYSAKAFQGVEDGLDRLTDEAQHAYQVLINGGEPQGAFHLHHAIND